MAVMQAQALICTSDQKFSLERFDLPPLKPDEVLIRTLYSGVSVGTEFAVIQGKLNWGPFPVCTGYQAVGEIEQVGAEVDGFAVGDQVYYRRNDLVMTRAGQKINNAAGTHCSHAVMAPATTSWIERLPAGINLAAASMFVMPAVGFNAVNMAGVRMGEVVAVQGAGLIGLGALNAAKLRGAVTIALDINPTRLALAQEFGIDHVINSQTEDVKARIEAIQPGGPDIVFEGTGIPALLDPAFALCRRFGKFVFLGNYGNAPISFHYLVPHAKELTAFFPCNDGLGPCRRAVVKHMAGGELPWEKTISHQVNYRDSPDLYQQINRNELPDMLGAVIDWSEEDKAS
jgi:2-desacetyl-2-hydroxyethyl bacteriochlorophyllide A dehydrogenase